MPIKLFDTALINEEYRATKLFLFLFYFITLSFDFVYFYFLPTFVWHEPVNLPPGGLGYGTYIIEALLLIMAIYLFKKNKPHVIKYLYFIVYILLNIVNEILIYTSNDLTYRSGNIFEIALILFCPIFVNKSYFLLVSIGTIFKYSLMGIILNSLDVIFPIAMVVIVSCIAFILLNRFQGYVTAVKATYNLQMEGIVKAVITTLELKDPYTRGHSERVAEYSMLLAKAVNKFSEDQLTSFNYACLLHDIGKVNIPDSILTKPGRLTDEEYEIIKTHPVVGEEAINGIEILEQYTDVIRHHHERWDGTGYPDGLKGEQISLLARIIAIADAFDAITSSRSYRAALSPEEAYNRIVAGKGTQFDPQLIEVFRNVYPSWKNRIDAD